MKIQYKNKRDQYKAESEANKRSAEFWKEESEKKRIMIEEIRNEKKRGLSCIVYCSQCQIVYSAIVPFGQTIQQSGCAHCGVKGCGYLVKEVK